MKDRQGYTYTDLCGDQITVYPDIGIYQDDNNIYLGISAFDPDIGCIDHYSDVTVNIFPLPYLESAIDTNNNGTDVIDFLVNNDFGYLTSQMIPSGYCWYPVFHFNESRLREINPEVFEEYAKAHGRNPKQPLNAQIDSATARKTFPEKKQEHSREKEHSIS